MPENVINFPVPQEKHLGGEAKCIGCQHRWIAVAPVGIVELECPQCRMMKGRFVYGVGPREDERYWACACGNDLFLVIQDQGYLCTNCGVVQSGF